MRIDVQKFLFVGVNGARDAFFNRAQKEGIIEFIDESTTKSREVPQSIHDISQAIKVLRGLPIVEQEEIDDYEQAESVAKDILQIKHRIESLEEEERILRQEIARVEVFGNFLPEDLAYIQQEGERQVQFFAAKQKAEVEAVKNPNVIYISSAYGLDYYIAINREPQQYEGMIEMIIDEPVGQLIKRREERLREIDEQEEKLKTFADRNTFLHEALIDLTNVNSLAANKEFVSEVMEDKLFAVQGWVAKHHEKQMEKLIKEMDVHAEGVATEEKDKVPTFLENKGLARVGEDLVHIYDTPSITDKDPSTWVFWSFALFFAIILGDGGYGLIFLALSLFLRFKFPQLPPMGARVLKLSTILSISCIGWGVLTNSFFGIDFHLDNGVREYSGLQWLVEKKAAYHMAERDLVYQDWAVEFPELSKAQSGYQMLAKAVKVRGGKQVFTMLDKFSDNIMLELALVIGIIHISLSFLRSIRENWAGIGWIVAMIGGYLYVPEYLNCTSGMQFLGGLDRTIGAAMGKELMSYGVGSAVLLALMQHRLGGAGEIINIIQVFADVLSYLRLYALGLAGTMMSATFNEIGSSVPIVIGALVIIVGHLVNIVLSIMGGVIHGLRLNFLEWYHYCFEGGGKMFKPLQLLKIKQTTR